MLVMIPFTVDEVIAMAQFMADRVRAGKPFWRTFWVGDTIDGGGPDARTPRYGAPLRALAPAAAWGVSVPSTLVIAGVVGIWLMVAPALLRSSGVAADSDRLVGALVLTVAAISTAEVARAPLHQRAVCRMADRWVVGDGRHAKRCSLERHVGWIDRLSAHPATGSRSRAVRRVGSVRRLMRA